MVISSSQEWFLEVVGKKTGPFSTEQVLGLLADKEIRGTQRITADLSAGWVGRVTSAEGEGDSAAEPEAGDDAGSDSDLREAA